MAGPTLSPDHNGVTVADTHGTNRLQFTYNAQTHTLRGEVLGGNGAVTEITNIDPATGQNAILALNNNFLHQSGMDGQILADYLKAHPGFPETGHLDDSIRLMSNAFVLRQTLANTIDGIRNPGVQPAPPGAPSGPQMHGQIHVTQFTDANTLVIKNSENVVRMRLTYNPNNHTMTADHIDANGAHQIATVECNTSPEVAQKVMKAYGDQFEAAYQASLAPGGGGPTTYDANLNNISASKLQGNLIAVVGNVTGNRPALWAPPGSGGAMIVPPAQQGAPAAPPPGQAAPPAGGPGQPLHINVPDSHNVNRLTYAYDSNTHRITGTVMAADGRTPLRTGTIDGVSPDRAQHIFARLAHDVFNLRRTLTPEAFDRAFDNDLQQYLNIVGGQIRSDAAPAGRPGARDFTQIRPPAVVTAPPVQTAAASPPANARSVTRTTPGTSVG